MKKVMVSRNVIKALLDNPSQKELEKAVKNKIKNIRNTELNVEEQLSSKDVKVLKKFSKEKVVPAILGQIPKEIKEGKDPRYDMEEDQELAVSFIINNGNEIKKLIDEAKKRVKRLEKTHSEAAENPEKIEEKIDSTLEKLDKMKTIINNVKKWSKE